MKNSICCSLLILLMAFSLLAFKAPEKDPRVITPDIAALVVVSKPPKIADRTGTTAALLHPDNSEGKMNARGYLDADNAGNSRTMAKNPVETVDQAGETEAPGDAAVMKETEIVASIKNNTERIEKAETGSMTAPEMVYTVQTGSFQNYLYAQDQFDAIMETLSQEELQYLRIETVGQFNAVRLGRFGDFKSAEEFLMEITPRITDAIILRAYIIDNRITQQLVE